MADDQTDNQTKNIDAGQAAHTNDVAAGHINGQVSVQMKLAIEDSQRLIAYIAKNGEIRLPQELAQAVINAAYKAQSGQWSAKDEGDFLLTYDKLSTLVYPVTIESINAIMPMPTDEAESKRPRTQAEQAVAWYRRYTLVSLAVLLVFQLYWLIGSNLDSNLKQMFSQRHTLQSAINQAAAKPGDEPLIRLEAQLDTNHEQLDANYQLLKLWNRVASFGLTYNGEIPLYSEKRLEIEVRQMMHRGGEQVAEMAAVALGSEPCEQTTLPGTEMSAQGETSGTVIQQGVDAVIALEKCRYRARIMYFKNILAAEFFLESFQGYLLPLLYGLLGAFIYVLRSLWKDIRTLTYTADSEVRYRLRLTLGSLGGMVVGWFFKPEEAGALASLSPMAMAFLMGYNVDVLFSIMDKIIDNIRRAIGSELPDKTQNENSHNRVNGIHDNKPR